MDEIRTDRPPPRGRWIICGAGRLGLAAEAALRGGELELVVIDRAATGEGKHSEWITGDATQAEVLRRAGIEKAVGIVAATSNDVDSISILVAARRLEAPRSTPSCGRTGGATKRSLPLSTTICAWYAPPRRCRGARVVASAGDSRLPCLARERPARTRPGSAGNAAAPATAWPLAQPEDRNSAANRSCVVARAGRWIRGHARAAAALAFLRPEPLALRVLALEREGHWQPLPEPSTLLRRGDVLLVSGTAAALADLKEICGYEPTLYYVLEGRERPQTWLGRWWAKRAPEG